jgi:predicted nucleic acid-binding protein
VIAALADAFADTVFRVALVSRADQYHSRSQAWAGRVTGRMVTTDSVLTETANTLARSDWRGRAVGLIDHLLERPDVEAVRAGPTCGAEGGSCTGAGRTRAGG